MYITARFIDGFDLKRIINYFPMFYYEITIKYGEV